MRRSPVAASVLIVASMLTAATIAGLSADAAPDQQAPSPAPAAGRQGGPPTGAAPQAAGGRANRASLPLPTLPLTFETEKHRIRVVQFAGGLTNPWSLAFLPNGDVLVTERAGRLRIVRGGVLDPQPIAGVPAVRTTALGGLLEVALHPKFAENQLVYLTYAKAQREEPDDDRAGARPLRRQGAGRRQGHLRRQQLEQVGHQLRRADRV